MIYKVFDKCGKYIDEFYTYEDAFAYKGLKGRMDWTIKEYGPRESTERQRAAVEFCERILEPICDNYDYVFNGHIELFDDCSAYLSKYLDLAKRVYAASKEYYDEQRRLEQEIALENSNILDKDMWG
jgi:glutathione S-transferase